MTSQEILSEVIALVKQAGDAIMQVYNDLSDLWVAEKIDRSPLTEADLQSDLILKEGLKKIADYPYLSEESEQISFEERSIWETYWLVDPLDGTKEFLKRTHEFTVNVALLHKNELVLGVVYAPAIGVMYFGSEEMGAYREIIGVGAEKLPLESPATEGLVVVVSQSHSSNDELELAARYTEDQPVSIISVGSSIKFCLLAEGSADIYPRVGPTKEWDTAAGHAVLNFSGGKVIDLSGNQPLKYNKENLLNGGFVALGKLVNRSG